MNNGEIFGLVIVIAIMIGFPWLVKKNETGKDGIQHYRGGDGRFISKTKHKIRMTITYTVWGILLLLAIKKMLTS